MQAAQPPAALPTAEAPAPSPAALLQGLGRLVVKDGVALGLLPADEQALALALVWADLPDGVVMNEREVNEALRALLAGPLQCLATDHVELRRWLADGGWVQRDGYGREYRRVAADALPRRALGEALLRALGGTPAASWAAAQREAHAAARAARRQRWQQGEPGQST